MLFSCMLHFFAIIGAISVLSAPLPSDETERTNLFDLNEDHDKANNVEPFFSEKGKELAKGNWLRKPHPKDLVWIISDQTCTHISRSAVC